MSSNTSPLHFNDPMTEEMISDEKFKVDISQKMKVPSRITFNSDANGVNHNAWTQENLNMHVPERILVVGQQQHIGMFFFN